jgi:hypothetical protein
MGYSRNGQDFVNTLCEVSWGSDDKRGKADINTSKFWFGGASRATNYPSAQFITYVSGFRYSKEALGGKYGGWPTFQRKSYEISAKGYRPYSKYRYSTSTSGNLFIKRGTDGSIFVTSAFNSGSGTVVIPAALAAKYCFVCTCGGGGGGGGSTAVASAGGGGGAGYGFLLLEITKFISCYIGESGAGGGGTQNGSWGADSSIAYYADALAYRNGGSKLDEFRCYAGESGYGGGNNGGSGGAGKGTSGPATGTYIYAVARKAGASGATRNGTGGTSGVNFTNYTPESETITYFTGGGGSSGGSSGGGGGGGSPLGQGGSGGSKGGGGNGTLGSGGGGGGYKAFTTQSGGSGGPGYISIMY